nr:DUF6503 family protein [Allomuricauda sp.]
MHKSKRLLILFAFLFLFCSTLSAQTPSAEELLNRSIAFHDPKGVWSTFSDSFKVKLEIPNSSDRLSSIHLDIPKQYFKLEVRKDNVSYSYVLDRGDCEILFNGSPNISEEDKKTHRLSCERGKMMKNYYTYLYGLPMKLKNPGTLLDPKVTRKTFKGKEYLVLKASYEEGVGSDVWYFYFDPNSYAMETYQFYHDESKNDGEYILLDGIEDVGGIKMPKTRKWFYNSDDKFLGTDILVK